MESVNPNEHVSQIHLAKNERGEHTIEYEKTCRQPSWILLPHHIAPACEKTKHTGERPADQVGSQKCGLITFFFHEERVKEKQSGTLDLY